MLLVLFLVVVCIGGEHAVRTAAPPQEPPSSLVRKYTMDSAVPLEYFYVDDSNSGNGTHFRYSRKDMDRFITGAGNSFKRVALYARDALPKQLWFHSAMLAYEAAIAGRHVCVLGSMEPWAEAALLALGAARVVAVDYNRLSYDHPQVETLSASDFPTLYDLQGPYFQAFSLCVAASSFDHDGLGRYGDPLNPDADLESVGLVRRLLHPNSGLLLLSVPIGPDAVIFNLMRRYGPVRLPLLLQGWDVVDRFGWREEKLTAPQDWRLPYEPVLVLKPGLSSTENLDL